MSRVWERHASALQPRCKLIRVGDMSGDRQASSVTASQVAGNGCEGIVPVRPGVAGGKKQGTNWHARSVEWY